MKLYDMLMQKSRHDKLGHFYLIESSQAEAHSFKAMVDFTHQFIRDYYQQIEGQQQSLVHLMDHPDVFVLGNLPQQEEQESKAFTVEQAQTLNRFFEFKPVQSKRKFAVITEAHRVGPTVFNKWLKLLEEPQGQSTIFLLNPRGQKLLSTVHSRAIQLKLERTSEALELGPWQQLLQELPRMNLAAFLEQYAKGEKELNYWVNLLILWESEQLDQIQPKLALERLLQQLQEMETFHQPTATKWTLFHCHLEAHVLSRVSR
jgi:hypothetical protein